MGTIKIDTLLDDRFIFIGRDEPRANTVEITIYDENEGFDVVEVKLSDLLSALNKLQCI